MAKYSKLDHEKHMNRTSPHYTSPRWIISGVMRLKYASEQRYGTAVRVHDPVKFISSYQAIKQ